MRWLKRQALAVGRKQGLQLKQGRTRPGGDNQLAGLITDYARKRSGVQQLALQGLGIKVFAAPAPNAQGGAGGSSTAHAVDKKGRGITDLRHKLDGKALSETPC